LFDILKKEGNVTQTRLKVIWNKKRWKRWDEKWNWENGLDIYMQDVLMRMRGRDVSQFIIYFIICL